MKKLFKAIFGNGDTNAESAATPNYENAVAAMNELMDNFKYGDSGNVRIDAKYLQGVPSVWRKEHPDAIALRIIHIQPYGCNTTRRIIGKVVICNN